MKKIYYLGNCTSCQAIIKDTGINNKDFVMQDIKFEKITPVQLEEMKNMTGSFEALFSRRALKYKELGLKDKQLTGKKLPELYIERVYLSKAPRCYDRG